MTGLGTITLGLPGRARFIRMRRAGEGLIDILLACQHSLELSALLTTGLIRAMLRLPLSAMTLVASRRRRPPNQHSLT